MRVAHRGGRAAGKLQAYWKRAGSSLSRIRPLGNYLLLMNGKGEAMDFNLTTMGGPLALNGSGSWIPGKAPDLCIMATPEESAHQDLAPLLRMFGRETGPGTCQLIIARAFGRSPCNAATPRPAHCAPTSC